MPEILMRPTPFTDAIFEAVRINKGWSLSDREVRAVARKFDQPVIGSGKDSIVVPLPGHIDKVFALAYKRQIKPDDAKWIFYVHRILNTAFPHNFPRIHASFGWAEGSNDLSGTIRQKIIHTRKKNPAYPFSVMHDYRYGLYLPIGFELHPGNITVSQDGGEYFLDIVERGSDTWKIRRFMAFMREELQDDEDKRAKLQMVSKSFTRLKQLKLIKGW